MIDWDAIYKTMRDAGMKPVCMGWKYRNGPTQAASIYTDKANKASVENAISDHLDSVKVVQIGTLARVIQLEELSDDAVLLL